MKKVPRYVKCTVGEEARGIQVAWTTRTCIPVKVIAVTLTRPSWMSSSYPSNCSAAFQTYCLFI